MNCCAYCWVITVACFAHSSTISLAFTAQLTHLLATASLQLYNDISTVTNVLGLIHSSPVTGDKALKDWCVMKEFWNLRYNKYPPVLSTALLICKILFAVIWWQYMKLNSEDQTATNQMYHISWTCLYLQVITWLIEHWEDNHWMLQSDWISFLSLTWYFATPIQLFAVFVQLITWPEWALLIGWLHSYQRWYWMLLAVCFC